MISILDIKEYPKLTQLAEKVKLDEKIDFKCVFLCEKDKQENLRGVAGTNFRYLFPRFEHIIIRSEDQKTKLGVKLMLATEQFLRKKKYSYYTCFVLKENLRMRNYAEKFGFKEYSETEKGIWFSKSLKEKI